MNERIRELQAEQEPVACPHGVDDGACKECYMEQTSDQYNGDDGPGFDEEFHANLLAGAHLLDDEGRDLFNMGWEAAKAFMEERAAAEQAEQEPVAIVDEIGLCLDGRPIFNAVGKVKVGQQLYAAPVRTKDLTDDEIREAYSYGYMNGTTSSIVSGLRAVIAADREKNK